MNDRKSPKGDQRAESVSGISQRSQKGGDTMESKSAIPDGNAEKRIENSKSYRRPLVRENLIQKAAKRYQNPFTTSVRKYRGLRGLVPEWEWALEVASLLVKLASSVPNRQVYVTSLEAT